MTHRCLLVCSFVLLCWQSLAFAQEAALGVYGQTTNEHSTHVMPHVLVRTPSSIPIRAEASYLVDISSRASVDLRTGAERTLDQSHHELSARLGYDWSSLRVGAHYRYVNRPDYVSHTFDVPVGYELSDYAASASLQPYVRINHIARIGDATFQRASRMFGLRASYQPWLDARTLGRMTYELQYADGYLASPYEFAGLGGAVTENCASASVCVPERLPETRLQHAAVIMLRRALTETISVGASYRFFIDDWAMTSHTLEPDFAWMAWPGGLLRVRYRGYFQSATRAYRDAHRPYANAGSTNVSYVAANELWSQLQTHRFSFDVEQSWRPAQSSFALTGLLTIGVLRIAYADAAYGSSTALEGTLWVALAI